MKPSEGRIRQETDTVKTSKKKTAHSEIEQEIIGPSSLSLSKEFSTDTAIRLDPLILTEDGPDGSDLVPEPYFFKNQINAEDSITNPPPEKQAKYVRVTRTLSILFQFAGMVLIFIGLPYAVWLNILGLFALLLAYSMIPLSYLIGSYIILFKDEHHKLLPLKKFRRRFWLFYLLDILFIALVTFDLYLSVLLVIFTAVFIWLLFIGLFLVLLMIKKGIQILAAMRLPSVQAGNRIQSQTEDSSQKRPGYKKCLDGLIFSSLLAALVFLIIFHNPLLSLYFLAIAFALILILLIINVSIRTFGNIEHPKLIFRPYGHLVLLMSALAVISFILLFTPGVLLLNILYAVGATLFAILIGLTAFLFILGAIKAVDALVNKLQTIFAH